MDEALIKKILPHSDEAERSVIGSMIMDRDAIMTASEILIEEDFYQKQYGVLFGTMTELYNEGRPVDLVTLQDRLKEKELPPELCSVEFIRDLVAAVPTSANAKYYANIVKEKAVLRRLIKVSEGIANECYLSREPVDAILEDTEKQIFDVVQNKSTGDFVGIDKIVLQSLESIEAASKTKGTVTGVSTGFYDLDYKTAGLQPSDLILVAARPSMGKTAFVLNIAEHVAVKDKKTTAIFSLEMSKDQLVKRMLAM
ncbi:MAG: replicative DNA helicase, partial [Acetivibrio ethanolgignens]